MLFEPLTFKRKVEASVWERNLVDDGVTFTPYQMKYMFECAESRTTFDEYAQNLYLDVDTKRAALRASASVVSIVSYLGEKELNQTSGTIIESYDNCGVILTSANLVRCPTNRGSREDNVKVIVYLSESESFEGKIMACDFHYNLVAIKIQSDTPLRAACLANLDDSFITDPSSLLAHKHKSFELRPHSTSYNLIPGVAVIALGRFFSKRFNLMAAPGIFRLGDCKYGCEELFSTTCKITRCGIGGPLINQYGEVIGICFYDWSYTPFLPINIASIWWDHYKKYGEPRRPKLGMKVANLHTTDLGILENFCQMFPNIFRGIIVEKVLLGSSAHSAGIRPEDVIVQFDGTNVQSFFELFEKMWSKVGDIVEVVVIRANTDDPLHLMMRVDEATEVYDWPLFESEL
ncbi:putative protease Do-like 14 [Mercurialis annua]|uniref:putative protease Do-like 14 n=1 Tax=Mercurialis annua TaxID=3986 RepID=UPI0024AD9911|nr:putative protease Do-like 14 [Mercurialis annua]